MLVTLSSPIIEPNCSSYSRTISNSNVDTIITSHFGTFSIAKQHSKFRAYISADSRALLGADSRTDLGTNDVPDFRSDF